MASYISAADIRVDGELKRFYWGLAIVVVPLLIVSLVLALLPIVVGSLLGLAFWVWLAQAQMLGNMMKVTSNQFPDILKLAEEAATRLIMKRPEVFITQSPVLNARATGFIGRKSVVLHSALVEALEPEELLSVIGHEFTHIKCNHTNLLVLAGAASDSAAHFSIPVLSKILEYIFLPWSRYGEYTCDRGGLLACRNLEAAIKAQTKLVVGPELAKQIDIDAFIKAGKELDKNQFAKFAENWLSHPYSVNRVRMLVSYYHSPDYSRLSMDPQLGYGD
jgi:Zn-dependent protease with chaperone function